MKSNMTTEEKAKAYDEALKQAKFYHGNCPSEPERKKLERMFPVLCESKDEKIRKALIQEFKEKVQKSFEWKDGIPNNAVLAWLEKQKYDRMKPIYDARESFESALEKAWNDYHNGYENVDKLEDDYVECAHAKGFREGYLFGIEKQKNKNLIELTDDVVLGLDRALMIVKDAKGVLPGYQSDDGIYECDHAIETLENILKTVQ